jgi:hypothetical protein
MAGNAFEIFMYSELQIICAMVQSYKIEILITNKCTPLLHI